MNILYISNFYTIRNSSAAIRNNSLVKGLIELGHNVDVLTVRQSETSTSPDLNYGNIIYTDIFNLSLRKSVKKIVNSKIKNILGNIYQWTMRIIHFPDSYYNWPNKIDITKFSNFDLIISSSDGKISHFVGRKIKKTNKNTKWIQIWGDPWYDDLNSNILDKIRIKHYEKAFISEADQVIYISLPTCNSIQQRYPEFANKIRFVPRSYFNECSYIVSDKKDLHIVYTGAISSIYGRNVYDFINVVNSYNSHNHTNMLCVDIFGNVDNDVKKKVNSEYVTFYDSVDVSNLNSIYATSNALLYISNKESSTQIPGKLYDYLGASSLIICLVNNLSDGIARFINSLGEKCFLIINDKKVIEEEIDKMVLEMRKTFFPNPDYSPKRIAQSIIDIAFHE